MPNESEKGFEFKYDREEFQQFAATFPFEETHDQAMAINAVISDMCQSKAMDRLVCGDVGFGKTEVAMRAAFFGGHEPQTSRCISSNNLVSSTALREF